MLRAEIQGKGSRISNLQGLEKVEFVNRGFQAEMHVQPLSSQTFNLTTM